MICSENALLGHVFWWHDFLLGKWILAQTFFWFVYPMSCTRAALEIHEFPHNASTAKTGLTLEVCVQLHFCHRLLWFSWKSISLRNISHFILSYICVISMSWEFPFEFKWWYWQNTWEERDVSRFFLNNEYFQASYQLFLL